MPEYREYFTPDEVDEQIEHFSSSLNLHQIQESSQSSRELVQQLRLLYQAQADAASLARVGERLRQREQALRVHDDEILQDLQRPESTWEEHRAMRNTPLHKARRQTLTARLNMIAAVVFLVLLVSSLVIVLNLARSNRNGTMYPTGNTASASTAYTLSDRTVYKFDLKRGTIAWSKTISTNGYDGGDIAVSNSLIYFSVSQGPEDAEIPYIYALRASDGSQVWRTPLDTGLVTAQIPQPSLPGGVFTAKFDLGFTTQPVVANGVVYVVARTGKVYALDTATGARRWTYDTHLNAVKCMGEPGQKNYSCFFTPEPTVAVENGVVYGTIQNEIYALDAENGSKRWAISLDTSQMVAGGKLVFSNGTFYTLASNGSTDPRPRSLYAFDAKTGVQQWVTNRFTSPSSYYPEVVDQVVYLGSQDGTVWAYNRKNGSALWHTSVGAPVSLLPAVNDSTMYLQTDKQGPSHVGQSTPSTTTLIALNASDGAVRWRMRIDRNGLTGDVLSISNGVIYVLTSVVSNIMDVHPTFHLFLDAYNASDGQRLWSKSL
jgi:outer membrane protein assembly factor BamB